MTKAFHLDQEETLLGYIFQLPSQKVFVRDYTVSRGKIKHLTFCTHPALAKRVVNARIAAYELAVAFDVVGHFVHVVQLTQFPDGTLATQIFKHSKLCKSTKAALHSWSPVIADDPHEMRLDALKRSRSSEDQVPQSRAESLANNLASVSWLFGK